MGLLSHINNKYFSESKHEGLLKRAERLRAKKDDEPEVQEESVTISEPETITEPEIVEEPETITEPEIVEESDVAIETQPEAEIFEEPVENEEVDDRPTNEMFNSDQWSAKSEIKEEETIPTVDEILSDENEENTEEMDIPGLAIEENEDDEIDDGATSEMFKNSQWDNSINNDDVEINENSENESEKESETVPELSNKKDSEQIEQVPEAAFLKVFTEFEKYCKLMEIEKAGLISCKENENGLYELILSYNLTQRDLNESESTKDFWDENFMNYAWHVMQDDDLDFAKCLFSEDINEDLYNFSVKRFNFSSTSFIFFAINCDFTSYNTIDLEDEIYKIKNPIKNFVSLIDDNSNCIESSQIRNHILNNLDLGSTIIFSVDFFNVKYGNETIETNKNAFGRILRNHISALYPLPDVVVLKDSKIKVVHFCKYGTTPELIRKEFLTDLNSFLGSNCLESISVSDFAQTDVMDEVLYHVLG